MSKVNLIDTLDIDDDIKTMFLNASMYIKLNAVMQELSMHEYEGFTATDKDRIFDWGRLTQRRLISPTAVVFRTLDAYDIDYESFEYSDIQYNLIGDLIFLKDDIMTPVITHEEHTDSIVCDLLASALATFLIHDNPHIAYTYIAMLQMVESLQNSEDIRTTHLEQNEDFKLMPSDYLN